MTYSGGRFNFLEPRAKDVQILDVAHALSNVCRFGGHCNQFYSVAQHAVLVSYLVEPQFAWQGLHHDDCEAYTGDIPTPLKQLIPDYKVIEHNCEQAIWAKYGLPEALSPAVKVADLQALWLEREVLLPDEPGIIWSCFDGIPKPAHQVVVPLLPEQARELFMNRYYELLEIRNAS
jgi:hypothetical protein